MREVLLKALSRYPVFTSKNVVSISGKNRQYAYLIVHRLKKNGKIQEIEKGKYTCDSDPLLVASWVTWPSYISSWAALNYYHLTEQLPFTIHVVTTRKRKAKTVLFQGTKLEFIKIKPSAFMGFGRITYQGKEIFMAEKEKAIVDGLVARKMSLAEAVELVKNNKGKLSVRKLFAFARLFPNLVLKLKKGLK